MRLAHLHLSAPTEAMATHRPVLTLQEFRNQCTAPFESLDEFRSRIGPSLDGRHQVSSCNFPHDGNPEWGGLGEWGTVTNN